MLTPTNTHTPPSFLHAHSGEEDEALLYSHRSALYRFAGDRREWVTRGVGDVKVLQHKESGMLRWVGWMG